MSRKISKNNKTKKEKKEKKEKRSSNKGFKSVNCSPTTDKLLKFTCYTGKSLEKLKQLWNARHPDSKIRTNDSKEIWTALKENMKNVCDTENCWLKQKFIENDLDTELRHYTFAPMAPAKWNKKPDEWLSSIDINKIMKQYEKAHPNFVFLGPSPIDFDKRLEYGECVWNELCNFSLEKHIKRNKHKIGVIFNTDTHDLAGSHWICLFINVKKKFIYFFDSNNNRIPKEVMKFVKKVIKQGNVLGIKHKYIKNKIQHQKTDTECGMYTLYVIIQLLLERMTPEMFDKRVPDEEMKYLRKRYFNLDKDKDK